MNPLAKKKERNLARDYLRKHPGCTYEQLIKEVGITSLSKPYFFNIRGQMRRSGVIPDVTPKRDGQKKVEKRVAKSVETEPKMNSVRVEILHTINSTGLTPELREHWKTVVLPVLRGLLPSGKEISLAFLTDPPTLEIRRVVG